MTLKMSDVGTQFLGKRFKNDFGIRVRLLF